MTPSRLFLAAILASQAYPLASQAFHDDWNPRLAAGYLDSRQKEWLAWKTANGPNGPCISCHTNATYLLARPALRKALGEKQPTEYEAALMATLRSRTAKTEAKEIYPAFAKEPLASQLLGAEAVHAALFLALHEAGRDALSEEAQRAFERLWSLQNRDGDAKGSWSWFSLNLDPWEVPESRFYGATLAAMAVSSAPSAYRKRADVETRIADLTAYLRKEQASQPLHNRLMLLWAAKRLRGVADGAGRKAIVNDAFAKQQPDGSWTIASLGPFKQHEAALPAAGSSSYATALAAFTLRQAGVRRDDPRLRRSLDWLRTRQDRSSGDWAEQSMNKKYPPGSMQVKFMRDAATAFAALALLE